jgi:signal peptidase I
MGLLSALPKPVRTVVETAITLVVALGIAYLGQAFVVKPYKVPTPSMVPTLEPGDRVLADRLSLDFENPGRGQIVVFHPPHCRSGFDDASGVCTTPRLSLRQGLASTTFVKRVIGLPGETVYIHDGLVYINDKLLDEPYLEGAQTACRPETDACSSGPVTVPAGAVFVMGDNRGNSSDSREWDALPLDRIIGKAWLSYWPRDDWGVIPSPIYAAQP